MLDRDPTEGIALTTAVLMRPRADMKPIQANGAWVIYFIETPSGAPKKQVMYGPKTLGRKRCGLYRPLRDVAQQLSALRREGAIDDYRLFLGEEECKPQQRYEVKFTTNDTKTNVARVTAIMREHLG